MAKGEMKLLHLEWDEIHSLTENIVAKVERSGYEPDVIIAVSRGGFVPARIVCDILSVQRLASVQIEYYEGVGERLRSPNILFPLNTGIPGLSALVIDDVSDTGTSLKVAKDHVSSRGASEVRSATLHFKPWSRFRPDYYAEEVDAWIVYPWEVKETMMSFVARLKDEGMAEGELRKGLMRLGYKPSSIDKYMGSLL